MCSWIASESHGWHVLEILLTYLARIGHAPDGYGNLALTPPSTTSVCPVT